MPPARFEQEPRPPLGLVDPVLEQARARDVVVLVAESVRLAHVRGELLVVLTQLCQHVERRDIVRVVVQDALHAADLADRAQGRTTDLAHAFGDVVGRGEDLVALFVEQEVVIAEVRPRYVPVEVLGLQVQREHVGEQDGERAGDIPRRGRSQIRRRIEGAFFVQSYRSHSSRGLLSGWRLDGRSPPAGSLFPPMRKSKRGRGLDSVHRSQMY